MTEKLRKRKVREGTHQGKRTKSGQFLSLRSMVPEITGVEVDEPGFDAAYKEIQRVMKVFQSYGWIPSGALKVHKDFAAPFVRSTRAFYNEDRFRNVLARIRAGGELTIEDHDLLIDNLAAAMLEEIPDNKRDRFTRYVEERKHEEFFEKSEGIMAAVREDLKLAAEIKHYRTKLQYLDEYFAAISQAAEEWRKNVQMHLIYDQAYERLAEKEPGLLQGEPLDAHNMPPLLQVKIIMEAWKIILETGDKEKQS